MMLLSSLCCASLHQRDAHRHFSLFLFTRCNLAKNKNKTPDSMQRQSLWKPNKSVKWFMYYVWIRFKNSFLLSFCINAPCTLDADQEPNYANKSRKNIEFFDFSLAYGNGWKTCDRNLEGTFFIVQLYGWEIGEGKYLAFWDFYNKKTIYSLLREFNITLVKKHFSTDIRLFINQNS